MSDAILVHRRRTIDVDEFGRCGSSGGASARRVESSEVEQQMRALDHQFSQDCIDEHMEGDIDVYRLGIVGELLEREGNLDEASLMPKITKIYNIKKFRSPPSTRTLNPKPFPSLSPSLPP